MNKTKLGNWNEKVRKENKKLILNFIEHLKASGLSSRIIKNHKSNLELLNDYLGDFNQTEFVDADSYEIGCFIEWCIDKWMFNTVNEFILFLSSIKQFYNFLQQKGLTKNTNKINEICKDKDKWAKKFNMHKKLLGNY